MNQESKSWEDIEKEYECALDRELVSRTKSGVGQHLSRHAVARKVISRNFVEEYLEEDTNGATERFHSKPHLQVHQNTQLKQIVYKRGGSGDNVHHESIQNLQKGMHKPGCSPEKPFLPQKFRDLAEKLMQHKSSARSESVEVRAPHAHKPPRESLLILPIQYLSTVERVST